MIPFALHFIASQIEQRPLEDLDVCSLPRARVRDNEIAYLGDRITEWITVDVDDLEEIIE